MADKPLPFFKDCAEQMEQLDDPNVDFRAVMLVIWCSIRGFFVQRPGQIILSAFLLLMLWGFHGNLELLHAVFPAYRGPGVDIGTRPVLIPGVPWDNELISFWGGCLIVVGIPILIIKFIFKQSLTDFGLGLPPPGRRRLALITFGMLMLVTLPFFVIGHTDPSMQAVYPFYRPITDLGTFILYELTYLPFFIAIEFIFRGYLLFGLAGVKDEEAKAQAALPDFNDSGAPGVYYFAHYGLLIQMLSYTAWHLGKPVPELWGTFVWGLAAGATAYSIRSIWPIIAAHWLLNVVLDLLILRSLGMMPF
jgi:hypothetical protein